MLRATTAAQADITSQNLDGASVREIVGKTGASDPVLKPTVSAAPSEPMKNTPKRPAAIIDPTTATELRTSTLSWNLSTSQV